jgi:hypothetical protein
MTNCYKQVTNRICLIGNADQARCTLTICLIFSFKREHFLLIYNLLVVR